MSSIAVTIRAIDPQAIPWLGGELPEDRGPGLVLGSTLHAALGVREDFTGWMETQLRRAGLASGSGFAQINEAECLLTLDAAKSIAMLCDTEQGAQARRYFIAAEKQLPRQSQGEGPPQGGGS